MAVPGKKPKETTLINEKNILYFSFIFLTINQEITVINKFCKNAHTDRQAPMIVITIPEPAPTTAPICPIIGIQEIEAAPVSTAKPRINNTIPARLKNSLKMYSNIEK